MVNIVLTNAYRPGNQGDLMLVKESVSVLKEFNFRELFINSLEPESFSLKMEELDEKNFIVKHSKARPFIGISNEVSKQIKVGLAVGGGYLRFGNFLEAFKADVIHLAQLRKLVRLNIPFAMLPQSIGPSTFMPRDFGKILKSAAWVAARDNKTLDLVIQLAPKANVWRCPDLIALALDFPKTKTQGELIGLIFKKDPIVKQSIISKLLEKKNTIVLIQSDTGGRNDDSRVTSRYSKSRQMSADVAWGSGEIGSVISMRLHGALAAISKGTPAIHIATERKGYGVFADLGLEKFLFNRRNFDVDSVYKLAQELITNESLKAEYWQSISDKISIFGGYREELRARIAHLLESTH